MTADQPPPLEPVSESWDSALAVVAHPDDLEYGAASAVGRWTGQGKHIAYCLATSGEAGIDGMPPEEAGPAREAEERASAKIVGVDSVEFLGLPDGMLEYGLPLRREIAAAIRRHRSDVVISMNRRETFGPGALNQADHIAVGAAVIDAVRDAANRWVFRELLERDLQPWGGVRAVLEFASPRATHAVDVSDQLQLGVTSLRAHKLYLDGLGDATTDPEEFLESMARPTGTRLGVRYAASFEVIRFGDF